MMTRHRDVPTPPHEEAVAVVAGLQALGTLLAEHPDDRYRAATRARLVAMAAVRTPAGTPGAVRSPVAPRLRRLVAAGRRSRLSAALAGAALTVTALAGVLAASRDAAPGDLLYGVKRGGEQTQLALAGDATRGRTLLDLASTRLTELTELTGGATTAVPAGGGGPDGTTPVLAAGPDAGLVVDTLATMDGHTTRGTAEVTTRSMASADPAALTDLAGWAARQETGLRSLGGAVPEPAGPALADSADLVAAVAERATALVAALACTAGPAAAGADALGPLPSPCPPGATRTTTPGGDASVAAAPEEGAAPSAGPVPAPVLGGTAPSPAAGPGVPAAAAPSTVVPSAPPGQASAPAGRTPAAPGGPPGRGALELPATPPSPARPSSPPVDLPVPVCVSALGLPVLC